MYTANDFNFGIQAPALSGDASSGYGISIPNYGAAGASSPVGSYLQSTATPAVSGVGTPGGIAGVSGIGGMGGLGLNMDTAKLALGGLQTIGNLWQAWQANNLARDSFDFSKKFANTNLTNQIKSYNTTLEDKGRARAFTEGQTPAEAQAFIDRNRLPNRTI